MVREYRQKFCWQFRQLSDYCDFQQEATAVLTAMIYLHKHALTTQLELKQHQSRYMQNLQIRVQEKHIYTRFK